jgi:hypothetical protein
VLKRKFVPQMGEITEECRKLHDDELRNLYSSSNIIIMSRDSVVGIATSYGLEDRGVGVRFPVW